LSGGRCPFASRRGFLGGAGGGALAALASTAARGATPDKVAKGISEEGQGPARVVIEPFRGPNQAGILTAQQNHTYFATFDLVTTERAEVEALLRRWTEAGERLTAGDTAAPLKDAKSDTAPPDSGETVGLGAARLTLTFGFGAGLFVKDGQDRYGLAAHRPEALVDLPQFNGDQLEAARSGGDLSVQACADDPQVAFHAVRQLARLAGAAARLRWTQTGFSANYAAEDTPRNLMGFKDGTQNPISQRPRERTAGVTQPNPLAPEEVVWVSQEGPGWMHGGTYLVVRRIRVALEHWDNTDLEFQEQTIGRRKYSGAPLSGEDEFDPLDLDAMDGDGNPVIPDNAHVRMAAAASNDGAQILRRGYSYNDGVNVTAERWPPWRQGLEYDAGLLFICYQRDPRTGFIRIFEPMAKLDALNQYVTHTGGGLFACPAGLQPGEFIGQALFTTS
jgi:deferrochelatase/peroxidase EfeB